MPPKPGTTRRERKAARNADFKARRPRRTKASASGKSVQNNQPRGGLSKTAQKRRVNKGSH